MHRRLRTRFGLAGLILAALAGPAVADWTVKDQLIGEKGKASKDISGIACREPSGFPRTCVVIDDELQDAQVVTLKDGEIVAGAALPLITDTFKGGKLEFDGEGVAFADGWFYVIGSHGRPRSDNGTEAERQARSKASAQVVRFRLDADGKRAEAREISDKLGAAISADPVLSKWASTPLEEGGITVEGIAVRGDRLYAGFRGPVVNGDAMVLSVRLDGLFGSGAVNPQRFSLDLRGNGIRDLVADGDRFLILSGPVASKGGEYRAFAWDGQQKNPASLGKIRTTGSEDDPKPEAILPLGEKDGRLELLVLSDGAKNGGPDTEKVD